MDHRRILDYEAYLITEALTTDEATTAYQKYFSPFVAKARYEFGIDRDEASDVVQDALVRAWQRGETYRGDNEPQLRAWLWTVVKNAFVDTTRRNRIKTSELDPRRHQRPEETEDVDFQVNLADAKDALRLLPPSRRVALKLYYEEDLSHKQIADRLGITVGASKSNLAKGRDQARGMVGLARALKSVGGRTYEIYALHVVDKKTVSEIAAKLNIPVGEVKKIIERGKRIAHGEYERMPVMERRGEDE